jgi:hypothetical protein
MAPTRARRHAIPCASSSASPSASSSRTGFLARIPSCAASCAQSSAGAPQYRGRRSWRSLCRSPSPDAAFESPQRHEPVADAPRARRRLDRRRPLNNLKTSELPMQTMLLLLIAVALTVARLFVPTVGHSLADGLHCGGSHFRRRDADAALAAGRALAAWLGVPAGAVAA